MALSPRPVDRLIRLLIRTGRAATIADVQQIIQRMATAPFDSRPIPTPVTVKGQIYLGRTIGAMEDALFAHLVKRVLDEEQWSAGTTTADYLDDLCRAVLDPLARLVLFEARGGHIAATITPVEQVVPVRRRGRFWEPHLLVIYSGDRGSIITGYQFSTLEKIRIPEGAQWLK